MLEVAEITWDYNSASNQFNIWEPKMSLTILNGSAYLGLRLSLDSFPQLLQAHRDENPTTPEIEQLGQELAQRNFPEDMTTDFVRRVCEWGDYPGIWGRVLKNNLIETICQALRDALLSLATGPSPAKALTQVNALSGLGSPSFASKHLRFLRPDICPVLDSILHDLLPYSFDPDGYSEFCKDCRLLAKALAERRVANPIARQHGVWFAADVEGALYMFARELKQGE